MTAAFAAFAWLGVLLQLYLSLRLAAANGKSIAGGILVFLGYFTILTNILVCVALIGGIHAGYKNEAILGYAHDFNKQWRAEGHPDYLLFNPTTRQSARFVPQIAATVPDGWECRLLRR